MGVAKSRQLHIPQQTVESCIRIERLAETDWSEVRAGQLRTMELSRRVPSCS